MQSAPPDALRTAHATTHQKRMNMSMTRSRKAMNGCLDARSNLCYTHINVEQDHNFGGDGCRAFHGSGGSRRAIVHPQQRAKSKGLSTKLLR